MPGEQRSQLRGLALTLPLVVFMAAMLFVPLAALVRMAAGEGWSSFFVDDRGVSALLHSLVLSAVVAVVSTAICVVPAWVLARWEFHGRLALRTALTVPLTFSGVVVGFLAILMLGRTGVATSVVEQLTGSTVLSGLAYGPAGLLLAYLYFEIPRATLSLEAAFREIDIDQEAAAAVLGANALQRMTRFVLPLSSRAVMTTLFLAFSVSLGSYGVALLLPVDIYSAFTATLDDGRAATLSLLLIAISLLVAAAMNLLRRSRD
jgi:putative spermidine/putrescine transport system permease protein